MRRKRQKVYTAPALEKGLDIIELLAGEAQPLAAPEIADRLDRSVGQIFRMIVVLEQRGYIESAGSDQFRLTLKMLELAVRDAPIQRLSAAAVEVMWELSQETQQSCHLVIYNNGRGIVIAMENAPSDRSFSVRLGAEVPLVESCSGHLLLAFADAPSRDHMLNERPPHLRKHVSMASISRIIDGTLERGYESIKSQQVAGVRDVGFPVFDHSGRMVAALVIPYLEHIDGSQAVNFQECTELLGKAARRISAALSAPGT